jgi:hypothetical protein
VLGSCTPHVWPLPSRPLRCLQIWISLALNPNLPAEERSAVPFVTMLRFLGPQLQVRFRDYIMRHVRPQAGLLPAWEAA